MNRLKLRKLSLQILLLLFLLGASQLIHAQPNTLYFIKGIPQTKDLNPARTGITTGFYVSLPLFSKLDLEANTNGWNYNDLIHKGTGLRADSLVIDLDNFINNIDKKNFINESVALTILEGGYRKEKNFYGLSISERESGQLTFDKEMIRLIKYGNYPVLGQTTFSGILGVTIQQFHEIKFNFSHEVSKALTIGFATKLLLGTGSIYSSGFSVRNTTPLNGSTLDLNALGRLNISAPITVNHNPAGQIFNITRNPNTKLGTYLSNFGNPGFAIDLGFSYRLGKKTEISASLIDLGVIRWKQHLTQLTENGTFVYQGINVNDPSVLPPLKPVINQLGNDLTTAFTPVFSANSFSTLLPSKIYFGIDYELSKAISFSEVNRLMIVNNTVQPSMTAAANARAGRFLSLSASYSILQSGYDNIGLGAAVRIGPVQIYAVADHLYSLRNPATSANMNLRIGVNLLFDSNRNGLNEGISSPDCHCPY